MAKTLKLTIELVPSTAWYKNLRNAMPKSSWEKIRREVYAQYKYQCGICSVSGILHCHELWIYDDQKHMQKLNGFIALCRLCHLVKHIGFANVLAQDGKINFETVVDHFMRINGCDRKTFEKHKSEAFELWKRRSLYQWKLDLGEYEYMVNKRMLH